jgi:hypothetical protein
MVQRASDQHQPLSALGRQHINESMLLTLDSSSENAKKHFVR